MNTAINTSAAAIAERYLAAWNEREPVRRRARVAQLFADGATYADPMMKGRGVDGIDSMIATAQQQFPGHRFSLAGTPDGHNDAVRFSWLLASEDGAPVARGSDVAWIDADGRLCRVTGFLDAV